MHHLSEHNRTGWIVDVARGRGNVMRALENDGPLQAITPFQTPAWLYATYSILAAANDSEPCLVSVRRASDRAVRLVLPLAIAKTKGQLVAGFPHFGVADYGGPLLAHSESEIISEREFSAVWRQICCVLHGVDRISLANMPLTYEERANPLAQLEGVLPAAHARFVVAVDGTMGDYLFHRGKKYRKEVERCYRLLSATGPWSFGHAQDQPARQQAFNDLERLQNARWIEGNVDYYLRSDAVAGFYQDILLKNSGTGSDEAGAQIFVLNSGSEPIAVLYGVVSQSCFTLLRIASASGPWRRMSPGRLIVLEAMKHFVDRGIRTFDLGIGDYSFKRGLGAKIQPLVNLDRALVLKARPHVMLMQAKGWLRRHPQLYRAVKAARQKMSSRPRIHGV